jgi:flagellin-specific chaperone FliS
MFEEEAREYGTKYGECLVDTEDIVMLEEAFKNGAELVYKKANEKYVEQFTKAEEIILKLSACLEGHSNNNFEYELLQEAEQFLKDINECDKKQEAEK